MGTFGKVKKYSKPSFDIEEKAKFLEKELLKTNALSEQPANNTSDVYSTITYDQSYKEKLQDVKTTASGEEVGAHFGDTEGQGLGKSPDGTVTAQRFFGYGQWTPDANAIWYKTDNGWEYLSWGGPGRAYTTWPSPPGTTVSSGGETTGGWGKWVGTAYGAIVRVDVGSSGDAIPADIVTAAKNDDGKYLTRDEFDEPPTKVVTQVSLDDPDYFPGNPARFLASLLDTATQGIDYLKGKADELIDDLKSGVKGAPKKLVNAAINAGVIRGFVAPAWKTLTNHQDNNDPTSKTFRNNDPTSSNYKGPKNVTSSFSSTQQSQITAQANHVLSMLNGGKGPSNPNGTLTPSEIEDFSGNMNYPSGSYLSPGYSDDARKAFIYTFHSLPVNTTTVNLQDGKLKDFDSNYQFSDPRDASVSGDFTGASEVIHGVTQQAVSNGVWKPGDDGEPYYQYSVDTHGRGPANPIIGTQYNTQLKFSSKKKLLAKESTEQKWFNKKDVKPDYPDKAPPKMIDGWHPKLHKKFHPPVQDPTIKITQKDLNRQHIFKDDEIKEFTEMVDNINQLLDMQPELLPYVQQRYPANDTRLAALNYKMDIMLEAGKEYVDKHFPVNKTLFKRATESIKKNIELTDPKHFEKVKEAPKYIHLKKYDLSKITETVSRHFKKKKFHYKSWHKGHLF